MYLFFDTETTGLPKNWKAPTEDLSNWPRMIQLAWLLYDRDGQELSGLGQIIKPEGFTIPTAASAIHGITTQRARKEGVALADALEGFVQAAKKARIFVAHNISFDEKILGAELLRTGQPNIIERYKKICTMKLSTSFCAIPGPYGPKWPKLSELYFKLFNEEFTEAHDALKDIQATAKCFWEMKNRGFVGT